MVLALMSFLRTFRAEPLEASANTLSPGLGERSKVISAKAASAGMTASIYPLTTAGTLELEPIALLTRSMTSCAINSMERFVSTGSTQSMPA